jgi:hypothetical protein
VVGVETACGGLGGGRIEPEVPLKCLGLTDYRALPFLGRFSMSQQTDSFKSFHRTRFCCGKIYTGLFLAGVHYSHLPIKKEKRYLEVT